MTLRKTILRNKYLTGVRQYNWQTNYWYKYKRFAIALFTVAAIVISWIEN